MPSLSHQRTAANISDLRPPHLTFLCRRRVQAGLLGKDLSKSWAAQATFLPSESSPRHDSIKIHMGNAGL